MLLHISWQHLGRCGFITGNSAGKRHVQGVMLKTVLKILPLFAEDIAPGELFVVFVGTVEFDSPLFVVSDKNIEGFFFQIDLSGSIVLFKIVINENLPVEKPQYQPVNHGMAELFHEIERERSPAVTQFMEESDIRIESVRFEHVLQFPREKRVAERE